LTKLFTLYQLKIKIIKGLESSCNPLSNGMCQKVLAQFVYKWQEIKKILLILKLFAKAKNEN